MKAIIEKDIRIHGDVDTDVLHEHNIRFKVINDYVQIYPQKITLNEQDMNYVFGTCFNLDFIQIVYCDLGGYGCDFAFEIIDTRPKQI